MAIIGAEFPKFIQDFAFFARQRGSRRQQWPKRTGETFLPEPRPPDKSGFRLGRRSLIIGGTVIIGAGTAVAILRPWELFDQTDTLESLVSQAKNMEDEYKGQDLSDRKTREKYVDILAGIFAFHYPEYFPRQQLKKSVSFADTLFGFVQQSIDSSGKSGTPTPQQLENERGATASTDNRGKKITVNVASEAFIQVNLNRIKNIPPRWNPLKELRVVLLHEFNHLVTEIEDPVIFSIVDPTNRIKDKVIEGFRFRGIDERGNIAAGLDDLHEAVIELLAKNISQSDFGSYFSERPTSITGEEIIILIDRLETVLQIIGMSHEELSRLHKNSNLRQFLLILSDKAGINRDTPLETRVRIGSVIAGAIERNDQRTLQSYINQVKQIQQK